MHGSPFIVYRFWRRWYYNLKHLHATEKILQASQVFAWAVVPYLYMMTFARIEWLQEAWPSLKHLWESDCVGKQWIVDEKSANQRLQLFPVTVTESK